MWVLDYLTDLESDFSVFHRVDEVYELDGPRFFRLAVRLPAYDGVMRARLLNEQREQEVLPNTNSTVGQDQNVVSLTQFCTSNPDLIERKKVARVIQNS